MGAHYTEISQVVCEIDLVNAASVVDVKTHVDS